MVLIFCVATLVTALAIVCDRCIARTVDKNVLVDALKQNYREMNEIALEYSGDSRVQSLTAFTGKMYYREVIDDQIIIDPSQIDQFIKTMCDLDGEQEKEAIVIQWPMAIIEQKRPSLKIRIPA